MLRRGYRSGRDPSRTSLFLCVSVALRWENSCYFFLPCRNTTKKYYLAVGSIPSSRMQRIDFDRLSFGRSSIVGWRYWLHLISSYWSVTKDLQPWRTGSCEIQLRSRPNAEGSRRSCRSNRIRTLQFGKPTTEWSSSCILSIRSMASEVVWSIDTSTAIRRVKRFDYIAIMWLTIRLQLFQTIAI